MFLYEFLLEMELSSLKEWTRQRENLALAAQVL